LTGVPAGPGQTEADKTIQKYEQLGKEQDHVYGAIYSNMPNYNIKPAPKPAAPPAAAASAPLGSGPVVLGASPSTRATSTQTSTNHTTSTHPTSTRPTLSKPVLPLGSPRPNASPTTTIKPPAGPSQ
jgi:hypothetical protein